MYLWYIFYDLIFLSFVSLDVNMYNTTHLRLKFQDIFICYISYIFWSWWMTQIRMVWVFCFFINFNYETRFIYFIFRMIILYWSIIYLLGTIFGVSAWWSNLTWWLFVFGITKKDIIFFCFYDWIRWWSFIFIH